MIDFTLKIAKEAGDLLLAHYGKISEVKRKGEKDVVTNVDFLAEHYLLDAIRESKYDYPVLAEETGLSKGESDYLWVIDPLDGTLNYTAGLPLFCVSIGLKYKDEIVLGVIHAPLLGETYYAEKGKGAFLNGKKISVNQKKSLSETLVYCGLVFTEDEVRKDVECMQRMIYACNRVYRLGTAALGLAYVACGKLDAIEYPETNLWDVAAGALLVQEAGGETRELDGSYWTPSSTNIIAANKVIAERLVELVK